VDSLDRKRLEQYRKAADQGDPQALNSLALFLARTSNPELWDARSAVTLAQKAVAATNRKDPACLSTLAAAYASAREFAEAVKIQKEAMTLLGTDKSDPAGVYVYSLKRYESGHTTRDGEY